MVGNGNTLRFRARFGFQMRTHDFGTLKAGRKRAQSFCGFIGVESTSLRFPIRIEIQSLMKRPAPYARPSHMLD